MRRHTKILLFLKAMTPLHVGTGRAYAAHVDLPVQRDEYGFPSIWASSLKGALKSNIGDKDESIKKCFGPDPEKLGSAMVAGYAHSRVIVTDARLVLFPARVLKGIFAYGSSPHLLNQFGKYLEAKDNTGISIDESLLKELNEGYAIVSEEELVDKDSIMINELTLKAKVHEDLIEKIGLNKILPEEIYNEVNDRGLILIPDVNNISLNVVNRGMFIQYRVRLHRDRKTVEEGPWSEEYIPSNTILASLILCSGREVPAGTESGGQKIKCDAETLKNYINENMKVIFVGGKETIGRGLTKLYPM